MKINRDSWHYKLYAYSIVMRNFLLGINEYNYMLSRGKSYRDILEDVHKEPKNLCSYIRDAFIIPIACFGINLVLFALLLLSCFYFGSDILIAVGVILAVVILLGLIMLTAIGFSEGARKLNELSSDSETLVGQIYSSYKNNICQIVEIEKKNDD